MSVDVSTSPYAAPPASTPEDGLGYSRHYAQRIRDLGKTSKDSWIKRLWNHMFQKKDANAEENENNEESYEAKSEGNTQESMGNIEGTTLPPINRDGSLINVQQTVPKVPLPKESLHVQFSSSVSSTRSGKSDARNDPKRIGANSAPAGVSNRPKLTKEKTKTIPIELINSPYLSTKDREITKVSKSVSRVDNSKSKDPRRSRDSGKDAFFIRKPVHPYLSQHQDTWRPKLTRTPLIINLEKRAKATTEKAMKEAKIFTCVGPYPVDAYVRFCLRKRGWVEKFGPKANASSHSNTSSKLECEADEDFEVICDQGVPAPWEEEHGLYAMMSRCARHYPAKFIWGGRNVNSLILKSEVITNHFPKARYFSSKVLLAQSLQGLPWQNDVDPMAFFPRCYVLSEEDKDDIIDDFRTTACIALLKWVLRMYMKGQGQSRDQELLLQRENTKYEEVMSSRDCDQEKPVIGSIFDDIMTPEPNARGAMSDWNHREMTTCSETDSIGAGESEHRNYSKRSSKTKLRASSANSVDNQGDDDYEPCADVGSAGDGQEPIISPRASSAGKMHTEETKSHHSENYDATSSMKWPHKPLFPNVAMTIQPHPPTQEKKLFLPDLKDAQRKKIGGEVPPKAVEWALFHLERCSKAKNHEDIDIKRKGLSPPQFEQLLTWFYQISQNGAKVPITEGKLREAEEMLRRMKKICPQYELDGKRNIWIVKPSDKSKGIGIEFSDKLEDILKYVSNPTTQGTYVLQKYIERPLLIYQCKFDIRQWFLVTEWNPLTIWFYKESYLRICSQEFQYDSMHESVHLSNVAVQQNYVNGTRSDKLPDNNFMSSSNFKTYLSEIGAGQAWDNIMYPGMKHAIINTLIATQDITENRKNAFELYGADFMFSENFQPWLIEINASPGMAPTSVEKCKICAKVVEDTIRVVIDRRENKSVDTGGFELAFRDNPIAQTKCVETKFLLEGQRIRKNDLQRYFQLDQKNLKKEQDLEKKERDKVEKAREKEMKDSGETQDEKHEEDATMTEVEDNKSDDGSIVRFEDEEEAELSDKKQEDKPTESKSDPKDDKNTVKVEKKKDSKKEEKESKKDGKKKDDPLKDSPYNKTGKKEPESARSTKGKDDKKKGKK